MANHALPTTSSTYVNLVTEVNARVDDAVKENGTATITLTNPPTNLVRWNDTTKYWEINTGTPAAPTWAARSSRYDLNINGTVGATTPDTGAFTTLSSSGVASLGASSTVGGVLITTATNTQTLTNKTLTSPVMTTIVSAASTLTVPTTGNDTLANLAGSQTFTNKTLTSPKFSTGTSLLDVNSAILIKFPTAIASAVNYLTVSNAVTNTEPSITATGTDSDISINLVSKGTGEVTANGVPVVTTTSTQTLSSKTLTAPIITTLVSGGSTLTIPVTGSDTLANLVGAQSLINKTFTASAFNGTVGETTASTGAFTTLTATTSLNVTGTATATTFSGAGTNLTGTAASLSIGGTASVGTNTTITDDIATAATVYPTWVTTTTGNAPQKTSSTKLTFNPSTGVLSATSFTGAGTGLTGTAAGLKSGAISGGSAGAVPYQTASDTTGFSTVGTVGQFLTSAGTSQPTWSTLVVFPAGTTMLFAQTTAPIGWTKSVTHDNKALRVVSGSVSSGGTVPFTTAFSSKGVTGSISTSGTVGSTSLTIAQMPTHNHGLVSNSGSLGGSNTVFEPSIYQSQVINNTIVQSAGSGAGHTHSFSGSSSFTGTSIDMAVQYVDVIIATKD